MEILEQIKWERDVAIAQLKEIGIGFGEKTDKVREAVAKQKAEKPIFYDNCGNKTVSARCPRCHEIFDESGLRKYCGFCGQKLKVVF